MRSELSLSLSAIGRCARTGGALVCLGHFDYYSEFLVWTHHVLNGTYYKLIPYDHPAPEIIVAESVN
jgi:hypothetical protein